LIRQYGSIISEELKRQEQMRLNIFLRASESHQILARLEYFDLAGREIVFKAAEKYRLLRNRGITIRKTIDMIIGTFCIEKSIPLLHNDRDYNPMKQYLGLIEV
jgi:predicted nucleic acid-binding protein